MMWIILVLSILALVGLWELFAFLILGPLKSMDWYVWEWLSGDLETSPLEPTKLYHPYNEPGKDTKGSYRIRYIAQHKPTIFSKYFVEASDDNGFRVLRGSDLHERIELKLDIVNRRRMEHEQKN